jgi:thiamine-monophosphate kinase
LTRASSLGERGLLRRYLPSLSSRLSRRVETGPGDDAAVVRGRRGRWALTTDMLVEGVHFDRSWTGGEDLGHKSLAVNLSDLAAMGSVEPAWALVSLGITQDASVDFVDKFHRGLSRLAQAHGVDIVGGDTVRADRLTVSIAVGGWAAPGGRLVLRGGARPGDALLATGTLGDAAAGLEILMGSKSRRRGAVGFSSRDRGFLVRRLLRPEPRLAWGRRLAQAGATALMDSSDGLWRSVTLMCEASGTGAVVELEKLPLSRALRAWAAASGGDAAGLALAGGEDYELVLAAPPGRARALEAAGAARVVGRVTERKEGVRALENGRPRPAPRMFEHFKADKKRGKRGAS